MRFNHDRETADATEGIAQDAEPFTGVHKTGEMQLAAVLVLGAIDEAGGTVGKRRDNARRWLQGAPAAFQARYLIEALGYDYEATLNRLEAQWSKHKRRKKTKRIW